MSELQEAVDDWCDALESYRAARKEESRSPPLDVAGGLVALWDTINRSHDARQRLDGAFQRLLSLRSKK